MTGEFQCLGPHQHKVIADEAEDDIKLVDVVTGSRNSVDNVMAKGLFLASNNEQYIGDDNDEVAWVKDMLQKVEVKAIQMMHKGELKSFMTQHFAIGLDGRHTFWYMTAFEEWLCLC